MYAKALILGLLIAIGDMIGGQLSSGIAGEKRDAVKKYEICIAQRIQKCESLANMLHTSRSVTLQNYAIVQDQKAQFLDAQRETLIDAMIELQLDPKRYKIEHFLDEQFYRHLAK